MVAEDYHPQFYTATIYKWLHVLESPKAKQIVLDSLSFLVKNRRIIVYAFVIMPNHIHLIWQIQKGHKRADVQRDFLKYTAQQIKFLLQKDNPDKLDQFLVSLKDRKYQIWQRNSLSTDLWNPTFFEQKLNYIHNNPCQSKWQLSTVPEEYPYSSASFYYGGDSKYSFLTHDNE